MTAFAIGPLFSTLSVGAYLSSPIPFDYSHANIWLHTDYILPTVFAGNPFSGIGNASLWTLPIEAYAYALLVKAALCGGLRSRRRLVYALAFVS